MSTSTTETRHTRHHQSSCRSGERRPHMHEALESHECRWQELASATAERRTLSGCECPAAVGGSFDEWIEHAISIDIDHSSRTAS
jgi:hypothetical protein